MKGFRYKHGDRPLEGYTIQRAAGKGGFGEVYYAVSDSGREVALKVLRKRRFRAHLVGDAVGTAVDWATLAFAIPNSVMDNPAYDYIPYGVQQIDARYQVPFRYHSTGPPFEYELIHYAWMVKRDILVNQNAPPPE